MKQRMRTISGLPILTLCIVLCAGTADAEEETSETSPRLERTHKRFPNADANGDGVLTLDEARSFRARARGERPKVDRPQPPMPERTDTQANIQYGPHANQVLDLYTPESAGPPMPLVVFIHGGGFIDGDKRDVDPGVLQQCAQRRVAVASLNYRFITTDPFPAPLQDCARAIQFLRYRAAEYNLDPKRLAVYGGSAGGAAALWIGLHDDMAEPENEDPVLRQSTRVSCAGALRGQTSYDPRLLREWMGEDVIRHRMILPAYGARSLEELLDPTPERARLFDECSPIHHVSSDDPPIILFYEKAASESPRDSIHSIVFGEKLKEALDAAHVEVELRTDIENPQGPGSTSPLLDFLFRHLNVG